MATAATLTPAYINTLYCGCLPNKYTIQPEDLRNEIPVRCSCHMNTLEKIYHHPLLTPEELEIIVQAHSPVSFRKGDFLLKQGQTAKTYYCLEKGLIRSFAIDYNSNDITTGFMSDAMVVIDVASFFHRIPAAENLQALTDCTCAMIDFDAFQQLFHSISGFSEWGRTWMSQELFRLKQRSVAMITQSAGERYRNFFEYHPDIIRQAPLKHIATYLGITDTSLSRIRRDFLKNPPESP